MKIVSSFKNLEHTPSLDEKIEEKTTKLKKYMDGNFEVQWTCYVREDGAHCADIKLLGPKFEYHAAANSDSLYKTLDLAVNKIEKQIHKKKDKWKNHKNKHNAPMKDYIIAESEKDEQFWQDKDELEKVS